MGRNRIETVLLLIHTPPLRTYTARARITFSMRTLITSPHISHLRGSRSLAPQMYLKLHDRHIAHAVSTTQAHRHLIAHRAIESSSKVVHIYEFMCRVRGALSPHSLACLSRANAPRNAHAHSTDRSSSSSSSSSSMPSSSLRAAAQAPADPHDPLVGGRWSAVLKSIGDDTIRSYMSWRSRCPCSSP